MTRLGAKTRQTWQDKWAEVLRELPTLKIEDIYTGDFELQRTQGKTYPERVQEDMQRLEILAKQDPFNKEGEEGYLDVAQELDELMPLFTELFDRTSEALKSRKQALKPTRMMHGWGLQKPLEDSDERYDAENANKSNVGWLYEQFEDKLGIRVFPIERERITQSEIRTRWSHDRHIGGLNFVSIDAVRVSTLDAFLERMLDEQNEPLEREVAGLLYNAARTLVPPGSNVVGNMLDLIAVLDSSTHPDFRDVDFATYLHRVREYETTRERVLGSVCAQIITNFERPIDFSDEENIARTIGLQPIAEKIGKIYEELGLSGHKTAAYVLMRLRENDEEAYNKFFNEHLRHKLGRMQATVKEQYDGVVNKAKLAMLKEIQHLAARRMNGLGLPSNYDCTEDEIYAELGGEDSQLSKESIAMLKTAYDRLNGNVDVRPLAQEDGSIGETTTGARILIACPDMIDEFFKIHVGYNLDSSERRLVRHEYDMLLDNTRYAELLIYDSNSKALIQPILKLDVGRYNAWKRALFARMGNIGRQQLDRLISKEAYYLKNKI